MRSTLICFIIQNLFMQQYMSVGCILTNFKSSNDTKIFLEGTKHLNIVCIRAVFQFVTYVAHSRKAVSHCGVQLQTEPLPSTTQTCVLL